jgi:hypothetical protein
MSKQGLPKEWQRLINESGISEKERRENPQTMIDVLTFYKETTERPAEDQSLEKFHNAAADSRQYAVSPTSPNTYPGNYFGTNSFPPLFLFLFLRLKSPYVSSLLLGYCSGLLTSSLNMQEALRIPGHHLQSLPPPEANPPARSRRSCRVDQPRNLRSA